MKRRIVIECIAALLIILFLSAAISGLLHYGAVRSQLLRVPFIAGGAGIVSWVLPFAELGVVVLLLVPVTRLAGFFCSLFLVSLYTMYFMAMLSFSRMPVLYTGLLRDLSWNQHMICNLVFVLLTGIGIILYGREGRAA